MNKILSFVIILSFITPTTSLAGLSSTQAGTTAYCKNCNNAELIEQGQCLEKISSELCQNVEPEQRMTCKKNSFLENLKGLKAMGLCLQKTVESFVFLFELMVFSAKKAFYVATNLEETTGLAGKHLNSLQNYLAIEYYKAYLKASGTESQRKLKAALKVGGQSFGWIWDSAQQLLIDEYKTFGCYNRSNQFAIICSTALSLIIPTGGVHTAIRLTSKVVGKTGKTILSKTEKNKINRLVKGFSKRPVKLSKKLSKKKLNKVSKWLSKNFINNKMLPAKVVRSLSPKTLQKFIQKALTAAVKNRGKLDATVFSVVLTGLISKKIGIVLPQQTISSVADYVVTHNVDNLIHDEQ